MKVDILNIEGKTTGKQIDLPEDIFGIDTNEHAVYLAVKQFNAHQRQGTHSSKGRSDVAGSRRKIKKQKGTGTARAGDIKNPMFRGGGRLFGPKPHKYNIKLNKKVKQLARKSALTDKQTKGNIIVLEDFTLDAPKTNQFLQILRSLNMDTTKTLLVTSDHDKVLYLSSRNLEKASVTRAQDLNTYAILNAKTMILSEGAVEKIKETFA